MEHLYRTTRTAGRLWKARYRCDCGNEFECLESNVRSGNTKSCGCLIRRTASERFTTHGMFGTPTYKCWAGMKDRCNNSNRPCFSRYGGRGITYDTRWEVFENFLEDMGESPGKGWSIDRIDNDGNYCKENCQWLTRSDNSIKSNIDRRVDDDDD